MNELELIKKELIEYCQYGEISKFEELFFKNKKNFSIHFDNDKCFITACEHEQINILKYIIDYVNKTNKAVKNTLPIILKKLIEKGITYSTLNKKIKSLDFFLFESKLENEMAVKTRIYKLLELAFMEDSGILLKYLLSKEFLMDEQFLKKYPLEFKLETCIYENKNKLILEFLNSPIRKYGYDSQKNKILHKLANKGNIEILDFIFSSSELSKGIDYKSLYKKMLEQFIYDGKEVFLQYLIFTINVSQKEMSSFIEEIQKKSYIDIVKFKDRLDIINNFYEKKALHLNLNKVLNTQTEEVVTKRIKI